MKALKEQGKRGPLVQAVELEGSVIEENDVEFETGLSELNVENKILVYTQCANSQDVNINDLGFFRALDAEYQNHRPENVAENMITKKSIGFGSPYNPF